MTDLGFGDEVENLEIFAPVEQVEVLIRSMETKDDNQGIWSTVTGNMGSASHIVLEESGSKT